MEDSFSYKSIEYYIRSKDIEYLTKINKKYIIIFNQCIYVYDICKKSFLNKIIELKLISFLDFHPGNDNIFFVCSDKNVILYEIQNMKINQISTIEGHFIDVFYGCFNPFEPNIFLSVSKNGFLKIYDIFNSFPKSLINLNEPLKKNIEIKWGKKDIGFIKDDYVVYFEYDNFNCQNIKKYTSRNIVCNFYFLNDSDDSLIIISDNNFEIIVKNEKISEYKQTFNFSFYYRKSKILIIIESFKIQGLKIGEQYQITQIFNFDCLRNNFSKYLFLNENYLTENEICVLYVYLPSFKIYSYTIMNNNNNIEQKCKNNNNNKIDVQYIKKVISDIPLLISKNNNDYESSNSLYNPKNKNYFEINSVKSELIEVKKRSFLERKKKVNEYMKNYNNIKDIKEKYIFILILLINDNTNKTLLKEYLDLLKKNNEELKIIYNKYFEEYQDELNYYSIAFTFEECLSNYNLKIISQKDKFFDYLKKFKNLNKNNDNDIEKYEKYLSEIDESLENISYFNIPLDFSNEQLFYYRALNLIKFHLKDLYDLIKSNVEKYFKQIKEQESGMTGNEINVRINNYKKSLLYSGLDLISYNLKLCYNALQNSNNLAFINEIIILINTSNEKENFSCCYKYLTTAKKNITILQQDKDEFISAFFNYKEKVDIKIKLIKQFYKNILPLKCFRSLYFELIGKDSCYPFDDQNFTNNFVDNNFEVLDIPIETALGITDKFSMKIYLIPFLFKINHLNKFSFENEKNIITNGSFIRTGNHEIGHNFTNFNFYMENCNISIKTPRKKSLEFCEGGYYIDLALYGKILQEINLEQSLYILNEKNYQKAYIDFQYGFNNIKKEDLKVEGVFKGMCEKIINNLNIDFENKSKSVFIKLNPFSNEENKIYCSIRNDVLGRRISDDDYKKIIMKYG